MNGPESVLSAMARTPPRTMAEAGRLALALYQNGHLDEAFDICRRMVVQRPDNPAANLLLGLIWRGKNAPATGLFWLERAAVLVPNRADIHYNIGNSLRSLKRWPEAVTAYQRALWLEPTFAAAASNLGLTWLDLRENAAAEASLQHAISLRPDDPELLGNLAIAQLQQDRLSEAVTWLHYATTLAPDNPVIGAHLATALKDQGYAQEAETLLRDRLSRNPDNPLLRGTLAGLNLMRGDSLSACRGFREIITLNPESASAHARLGQALFDCGVHDAATAALLRAAALEPDATPLTEDIRDSLRFMQGTLYPLARLDTLSPGDGVLTLDNAVLYGGEGYFSFHNRVYPDLVFHLDHHRTHDIIRLYRNGYAAVATDVIVPEPAAPAVIPNTMTETTAETTAETEAILLGGCGNYYHWLFDHVPRLRLLAARPDLATLPLLVNAPFTSWQMDILTRIGLNPSRLRPQPLSHPTAWRVLHVPHLAGRPFQDNGSPDWWQPWTTADTICWLRQALAVPDSPRPWRKLFISRHDAITRRCLNGHIIEELATRHGFTVLDPGRLPLAQQIALFAEAAHVVGVHGAGFANLLFAPSSCRVSEFIGAIDPPRFYEHLARLRGQDYTRIPVLPVARSPNIYDHRFHHLWIDPAVAEQTLR